MHNAYKANYSTVLSSPFSGMVEYFTLHMERLYRDNIAPPCLALDGISGKYPLPTQLRRICYIHAESQLLITNLGLKSAIIRPGKKSSRPILVLHNVSDDAIGVNLF